MQLAAREQVQAVLAAQVVLVAGRAARVGPAVETPEPVELVLAERLALAPVGRAPNSNPIVGATMRTIGECPRVRARGH